MEMKAFQRQVRKAILGLGALCLCVACPACDRPVPDWALPGHNLERQLKSIEQSDRLVINGGIGLTYLKTITDRSTIDSVVALFERFPDGWMTFSAAPTDYFLLLYKDNRQLALLGLAAGSLRPGEDTLAFGDYFRRAPATDVAELVHRFDLPWPPEPKSNRR